ncbi:hypothetical protein [Pararcticibacter amylolyticus]|uniref:Uncharacterized protein n=1 Tax=Pararcticibacter amylolyticus TaxID=2173175 RepID=A0A2U2PJG7_9SPHI|nr:hypothetical protein [Pararcticibacter amylolyticus]PWG81402.1 hypothetical protein DDR33_06065 [Pararcticibacter amylolyticus]
MFALRAILRALAENEFVPYRIIGKDTLALKNDQCLFFSDIDGYHFLIRRTGNREYNLGYRLKPVDTATWSKRYGLYEQLGYQLLIGDSKFKSVALRLSPEGVLKFGEDGQYLTVDFAGIVFRKLKE